MQLPAHLAFVGLFAISACAEDEDALAKYIDQHPSFLAASSNKGMSLCDSEISGAGGMSLNEVLGEKCPVKTRMPHLPADHEVILQFNQVVPGADNLLDNGARFEFLHSELQGIDREQSEILLRPALIGAICTIDKARPNQTRCHISSSGYMNEKVANTIKRCANKDQPPRQDIYWRLTIALDPTISPCVEDGFSRLIDQLGVMGNSHE